MNRILLTACLLAHSSLGAPQRGVQLGGAGGPRPVSYGGPQAPQNFGPSYSQQLSFGAADAGRTRGPGAYQSPQPILLQQGNPTGAPQIFGGFPSSTPFPQQGRQQLVNLRSPGGPSPAAAEEEEYEEYEDDDAPPQPTARPPTPSQRGPVRGQQQLSFTPGPSRLSVTQSQPQPQAPVRQRQPIPQRQSFAPAPSPQQYSPQPPPQRVQSAAAPQQQQNLRPSSQGGLSYGLDGKRTRLTTPPPVQTLNRYMRNNEDGSITWGYENEDGTFKEETIGADCVVRGKYGYVDPEGKKREYEYQSGNPCDPNKKDQEEEEEAELREGPGQQQQLAGVINARPRPAQQQQQRERRPVPQYQAQQQQLQPQYA